MLTPQFTTKTGELTESFGIFTFEPLAQSFGESMGNALRRTLLSSLEGTAIVAVKIEGTPHLFSVLKGVKETALELTLNLNQVHFNVIRGYAKRLFVDCGIIPEISARFKRQSIARSPSSPSSVEKSFTYSPIWAAQTSSLISWACSLM